MARDTSRWGDTVKNRKSVGAEKRERTRRKKDGETVVHTSLQYSKSSAQSPPCRRNALLLATSALRGGGGSNSSRCQLLASSMGIANGGLLAAEHGASRFHGL